MPPTRPYEVVYRDDTNFPGAQGSLFEDLKDFAEEDDLPIEYVSFEEKMGSRLNLASSTSKFTNIDIARDALAVIWNPGVLSADWFEALKRECPEVLRIIQIVSEGTEKLIESAEEVIYGGLRGGDRDSETSMSMEIYTAIKARIAEIEAAEEEDVV